MEGKDELDRLHSRDRAEAALADDAYQRLHARHRGVVERLTAIKEEMFLADRGGHHEAVLRLREERAGLAREQVGLETEMSRVRPYRGVTVPDGTTGTVMTALRLLRDARQWDTPENVEKNRRNLLEVLERWVEKGARP